MAKWGVILCVLAAFLMVGCESSSKFDELFKPSWAFDHFTHDGEAIDMKLDSNSGAGFQSKSKYLFGKVTVQIKLVGGVSAGTVNAFYKSVKLFTAGLGHLQPCRKKTRVTTLCKILTLFNSSTPFQTRGTTLRKILTFFNSPTPFQTRVTTLCKIPTLFNLPTPFQTRVTILCKILTLFNSPAPFQTRVTTLCKILTLFNSPTHFQKRLTTLCKILTLFNSPTLFQTRVTTQYHYSI